jgi:periplasmic copper chaperone A
VRAAGGAATLAPGGAHLMLTGVKAPIRAGAKVPITLRFENAGAVQVVFNAVDAPGAAPAVDHSQMHH